MIKYAKSGLFAAAASVDAIQALHREGRNSGELLGGMVMLDGVGTGELLLVALGATATLPAELDEGCGLAAEEADAAADADAADILAAMSADVTVVGE